MRFYGILGNFRMPVLLVRHHIMKVILQVKSKKNENLNVKTNPTLNDLPSATKIT